MAISSIEELKNIIELDEKELLWREDGGNTLPLLISDNVKSLLHIEAIRRQFVPSVEENNDTLGDLDPLQEENHTASARLIHRYKNRAAFLVTDNCFAYCRHCFRRRFTGTMIGKASKEEIQKAGSYLDNHPEIKEVLLTGGDMFTLSNSDIDYLLSTFKSYRSDIIYRLCTRALLSNPDRFDDGLFNIIKKNNIGAPYFLMTQFNHPDEITGKASIVLDRFAHLGIPMMNQCVLLKGVNDSVEVQVDLCNKLMVNRVKPYYLFQGDLVKGTRHLRVPLSKGLEIEKEMRIELSGLSMPQYTIDLPDGGGKVILTENHIRKLENGIWEFSTPEGKIRHYPEL